MMDRDVEAGEPATYWGRVRWDGGRPRAAAAAAIKNIVITGDEEREAREEEGEGKVGRGNELTTEHMHGSGHGSGRRCVSFTLLFTAISSANRGIWRLEVGFLERGMSYQIISSHLPREGKMVTSENGRSTLMSVLRS